MHGCAEGLVTSASGLDRYCLGVREEVRDLSLGTEMLPQLLQESEAAANALQVNQSVNIKHGSAGLAFFLSLSVKQLHFQMPVNMSPSSTQVKLNLVFPPFPLGSLLSLSPVLAVLWFSTPSAETLLPLLSTLPGTPSLLLH